MKSATERAAASKQAASKAAAAKTAAAKTAAAKAATTAAANKAATKAADASDETSAVGAPGRSSSAAKPRTKSAAAKTTKKTVTPIAESEAPAPAEPQPVPAESSESEPAVVKPAAAKKPAAKRPAAAKRTVAPQRKVAADAASPSLEAVIEAAPAPREEETTAELEPDASIESAPEVVPTDDKAQPVGADAGSAPDALRVRGLVKDFGDHRAVNEIDLTVPAGSFYGIVGPNGAGKTTTLSIIAGLLRPDAGTVHISGIDQAAEPLAAKRAMGVLPDRLRTFDRLSGRQLLHYYGLLRGLSADVIEKRAGDLARAFDLGGALNRVVSDYSAGMTKKLMLAGAMIHSPRVLVLDEPFEAVDPVSSGVILDILRAYVAHGGTVILSSHGMDLVERVCSRVAIIVDGEVLAEGTVDEVRAGQTLESRFVELAGSAGEVEGLEWLHTFSD